LRFDESPLNRVTLGEDRLDPTTLDGIEELGVREVDPGLGENNGHEIPISGEENESEN
jgi:hypothetical protein